MVWKRSGVFRRTFGLGLVLSAAVLAACSTTAPLAPLAPSFTPHVPKVMVSCKQANRIAYNIIKEVGYTPTQLVIASWVGV